MWPKLSVFGFSRSIIAYMSGFLDVYFYGTKFVGYMALNRECNFLAYMTIETCKGSYYYLNELVIANESKRCPCISSF